MRYSFNKIGTYIVRHPFVFIMTLLALYLVVLMMPLSKLFAGYFSLKAAKEISQIIKAAIIVASSIYFVKKLEISRFAGIKLIYINNPLLLLIPLIYPVGFSWLGQQGIGVDTITRPAIFLAFSASIASGLAEEVAFRGLLLPFLLEKRGDREALFRVVCLAAFVFAIFHFINLRHTDLPSVFVQVIFAFFFGVFFGALLLRTGNVFILGFIHGCANFSFETESLVTKKAVVHDHYIETFGELVLNMLKISVFFLPLLIIGFFLIKGWNKEKLIDQLGR